MRKLLSKMHVVWNILFLIFCVGILTLSIRGNAGDPNATQLNQPEWKANGPLELSPERGRYALTYAVAENHAFTLTPELGRFAAPDVAFLNGKYVSLFAPGVSIAAVPGYLIGKQFGLAQVGTYAMTALFALLNLYLIIEIAIRLRAHPLAAAIAGLVFLFATPAYAYAVTLYQHHISTFLVLLGIYLILRYNTVWSLLAIWFLCALSIPIDYPNFFMMLPIGVAALGKTFITEKKDGKIAFQIPLPRLLAIFITIIPLALFLWFNQASYGDPFQLSGTIERAIEVKDNGQPVLESEKYKEQLAAAGKSTNITYDKNATVSFQSRLLLSGFMTHFISPDRGILFYTPVILFGFAGLGLAIRKKMKYVWLFIGVIGMNIILYSLWDDPYGGWAFGSRYLIPTYAVLSIFIATLITRLSKYNLFLIAFFAVLSYSVCVNTLGALTSNRIPPKVEAQALSDQYKKFISYTYDGNFKLLDQNISKSYVFQTVGHNYVSAWKYYMGISTLILGLCALLLVFLKDIKRGEEYAI